MRFSILISLFVLSFVWAPASVGGVITVKADGTGDEPDIQTAISVALTGDTICLVDALYTGPGNRDINFMGKAVTVTSLSGDPESCVIDFEGNSMDESPGFIFTLGEGNDSILLGLTLKRGWSSVYGTQIHCENSSPRIENCSIVWGGNIFGSIVCINSSPVFIATNVVDNFSFSSAVVQLSEQSSPAFTDCNFLDNDGSANGEKRHMFGGALSCESNSNPQFLRCRFSGNTTLDAPGAGVACDSSSPMFEECIFSHNRIGFSAGQVIYGNGLHCEDGSSPVLVNCLFINNGVEPPDILGNATYGGAISSLSGSHPVLLNCTLVGNTALDRAGGIYVSEASLTATNTLIAFNDHEAVFAESPVALSLTNCNLFGNAGGDWTGPLESLLNTDGNFSADPQFCDLPGEVFTLRSDSPCHPHNHPHGSGWDLVGALELGCFTPEPVITSISDVGNDQGRQVRLIWHRSEHDALDPLHTITEYGIYRYQDEFAGMATKQAGASRLTGWDFVGAVHARGDTVYQFVAPTLCDAVIVPEDSTRFLGNATVVYDTCWSTFFVSAVTAEPLVYFDSQPRSGFSIDNLAPLAPSGVNVAFAWDHNYLEWDHPVDEDVDHFLVYRYLHGSPGVPDIVFSVRGISHDDAEFKSGTDAWDYFYRIAAVDLSGNTSPLSLWPETDVTSVETNALPGRFVLRGNTPNPFNPITHISFELPGRNSVFLRVYDVSGKLIRSLLEGDPLEAGSHVVPWDGRGSSGQIAAAGIYFYRLDAGSFSQTKRMTLLK